MVDLPVVIPMVLGDTGRHRQGQRGSALVALAERKKEREARWRQEREGQQ